jgi:transcriptional regulator with XRE-family HTH domain
VEKNLADRLRARSAQLHLNAQQLATRAGVNRSFVYDILRRRSVSPAADKLAKVAEVLKVDTGWLLTGEGHVAGETVVPTANVIRVAGEGDSGDTSVE